MPQGPPRSMPHPSLPKPPTARDQGRVQELRRHGGQSSKILFNTKDVSRGLALFLAGIGCLSGLLYATQWAGLDTVLIMSKALYNIISGVTGIGNGIAKLLLGVVEVFGFLALAGLSLISLIAICSGIIRIGRNCFPQLGKLWGHASLGLGILMRAVTVGLDNTKPEQKSSKNAKAVGEPYAASSHGAQEARTSRNAA